VIRVLLVEDSPTQRDFLRALLESAGEFEVIGEAHDGEQALHQTGRLRPDIILMDCFMPRMDGLEATRLIMRQCPTPIVLTSADLAAREAEVSFEAMRLGALGVVAKPTAIGAPDHVKTTENLLRTLRLMSEVKVVGRRITRSPSIPASPAASASRGIEVVAIGGSTGAPGIIADILAQLTPESARPILVVQHISEGFSAGFASWLDNKTRLRVRLAEALMKAEPGNVYIAPDGLQMGISRSGTIQLADAPPENGFRPSVGYLFRSVAASYGSRSLGVLLTGMGCDGAAGLSAIRKAGGHTIAQSEETCIVFGMPRAAIELDAAQEVLAPSLIAKAINALNCEGGGVSKERRNDSVNPAPEASKGAPPSPLCSDTRSGEKAGP